METVNFDDFKKVEIRIGKILSAERVENSEKLIKLEVDFGEDAGKPGQTIKRQIIAGIGKVYEPENLVDKECPFVFNLEPKTMAGLESQGMILAADSDGPVLMHPDREVNPGSNIK